MKVGVVGLGNVLMRDDAAGPYVVRRLEAAYEFPEGVELLDLGTPGLDLHPFLEGLDFLILLDTVRSDGKPGEIRTYGRDEILKHPPQPRVSPHDPGVKEALLALEFAGGGPRHVLLIGVLPGEVGQGIGLSPAVQAAVPAIEAAVLRALHEHGIESAPRRPSAAPDIWWERDGTEPVPELR